MSHLKLIASVVVMFGLPGWLASADHRHRGRPDTRAQERSQSDLKYQLPPEETSLGDIGLFFAAVAAADSVVVLEGLPHQAFEHELRAQELKRDDIVWFEGHPFYNSPLALSESERATLTEIALRPAAHVTVQGLKMCGGFHPDYVVLWKKGDLTSGSLICFGCHEWKNFTPAGRLYEEIQQEAYGALRAVLSPYVVNRPKPQRS